MSDIFKSAHGALDPEDLEPLSDYIGRPHFPTEKEFDEAVEFMNLDPDCLFLTEEIDYIQSFIGKVPYSMGSSADILV